MKMKIKNKKGWAIGLGALVSSGVLIGILVPVLSKKKQKEKNINNQLINKIINAKSENNIINNLQKLYKLENKKQVAIATLAKGDLKTRYISALELAKKLFAIKSDYKMHLLEGKEKNSNLYEILLVVTPKDIQKNKNADLVWPLNQIDQSNDKLALLITFFKNQVLKVENKLATKSNNLVINANILFKFKQYDFVDLFYKFKIATPKATSFNTYNAFLDDIQSAKGLMIFKNYLLSLKASGSNVMFADLTNVKFTKGKINPSKKTIAASLTFSYQGLKASKIITDFTYKQTYQLSIKVGALNKMANEVLKEDINTSNLPNDVTINSLVPSILNLDGSTIKIVFNGGNIREQELDGFKSYQSRAKELLSNAINSDFSIANKAFILPSAFSDKQSLINQLKAKASSITNNLAKAKVENVLGRATIALNPNNQDGDLEFTITIGQTSKTFTINNFISQNINDEMKAHLQVSRNLNIEVPKVASGAIDYNQDSKIFAAIKSLLELRRGITSSHTELITKKQGSSNISSIPSNSSNAVNYEITLDGINYTLKVKQSKYNKLGLIQAWKMKNFLSIPKNLNISLIRIADFKSDKFILLSICNYFNNRFFITSNSSSNLNIFNEIIKKINEPNINSIPDYPQSIQYKITFDGINYTLKLRKSSYDRSSVIILQDIISQNLNIELPKSNDGSAYDQDSKILAILKQKFKPALIKKTNELANSSITEILNQIIKKQGTQDVTSIASNQQTPTIYWVTVNDEDFELKLNQAAE